MTKQEVIKQAYGEHWESVKDYLNENGWCSSKWCAPENITIREFLNEQSDGRWGWRPSSLKGLETNNGWIKIESEDSLPKQENNLWLLFSDGSIVLGKWCIFQKRFKTTSGNVFDWGGEFTHYQPITKPQKPLY